MKKKFISSFFALFLALVLSFLGVGGSYIQSRANVITDALWNTNASTVENIGRYLILFSTYQGAILEPTFAGEILAGLQTKDFLEWMISEGYEEDIAHEVVCGCGKTHDSHDSAGGFMHGGGGFVRDGIKQDDDGNITFSDEVSDLFYKYLRFVIVEECGYMYFKTFTVRDIPPTWSWFTKKDYYDNLVDTIKNNCDDNNFVVCYFDSHDTYNSTTDDYKIGFIDDSKPFYHSEANNGLPLNRVGVINEDWTIQDSFEGYSYQRDEVFLSTEYSQENIKSLYYVIYLNEFVIDGYEDYEERYLEGIFSNDGRYIPIWYDLNKYKAHVSGFERVYLSDSFNRYNVANDNSVTMTNTDYQYYQDNSTKIYYQIQDKIVNDDGNDLTENDIRDIINDAFDDLKNKDDGGGSDGSDGSGGSDDSSGGTGVLDVVNGIGKIFDTILSLIGKVMGVVADFTNSVLDLFDGFTVFTDGFSEFLTGSFGFIPTEVWNMVTAGLGLMVLLAVIKFLRK